jgi:hypothetical protein
VTTPLFHRRRADRLAELLDEATGSPRHPGQSTHDELTHYVHLGHQLVSAAHLLPGPSPDFRASLRAQLMTQAERDGIGSVEPDDPSPSSKPLITKGRTKGAILVGLAVGTLAVSGMSAASGTAMPGDPLYSVKRSTEGARLVLAGSDLGRGQLYLEFARNRLTEAQSTGGHDQSLSGMLDEMDRETRHGVRLVTKAAVEHHDRTELDVVDGFVARQRAGLASLGDTARVRQSLGLLNQITQRSARLRPALGCGNGPAQTDELGALVPDCTGSNPSSNPSPTHPGSRTGGVPHPGVTPSGLTSPTGVPTTPGTGTSSGPSTNQSSGLLDDLGRILGSTH